MASWPADKPPPEGYHGDPILWAIRGPVDGLPRVCGPDFDDVFDTTHHETGNRLRTFAHPDPAQKGLPGIPHYIATRGTTPLHTDPAYPRYSVQVAIYNHGLALTGYDGRIWVLPRGTIYCLDTHSPHRVVTSGKATLRRQKLQGSVDYEDEPLPVLDAYRFLYEYMTATHPTKG